MAEFLTSCFPYWDIGKRRGYKVFLCYNIEYFCVTKKIYLQSNCIYSVFPCHSIKYFSVTVKLFLCHRTISSVSMEGGFDWCGDCLVKFKTQMFHLFSFTSSVTIKQEELHNIVYFWPRMGCTRRRFGMGTFDIHTHSIFSELGI